ncbi:hypothetical protein BGZ83_006120 [Gryganskiella cystojenkinii]|nr:hypothetical protein BGZ83_006120 [Gryganskiella cystojenkinii]
MFWEDLAKHCSELDCIHFSTLEFLEFIDFQFPFRLFPREMAWGTKYHIANTTLNELNRQLIGTGDRLTSFELGWPFGQAPTQAATLSDRLSIQMDGILSVFLRRAKHLQHFKVSRDLPISTATLMGDLLKSSTAWACRGLLNLDISLVSSKHEDDKSHDWHGYVFGFLSRVCPRLQALRLQVEGDVLSLKYGLCLLIRLRDLRRLELEVVQPGIYELNALDESDFAWTRDFTGCSSSSSISKSVLTTNRLSRSPFPLFTSSSNSCNEGTGPSTSSSSSAYRDYMTCMERVQRIILFQGEFGPWWKDNSFVDWRQKLDKVRSRKRLEQQKKQQEKNYITDYSKALPVVDGLEFNVCGSYFDMEGCLQAQLSRLSSSEPPLTVYSYQNSSASESDRITKERSVSATPWSNMEQLIIKYKTTNQEPKSISNAKVQAHLDRGQSLLRRLRPDIEVHCVMR